MSTSNGWDIVAGAEGNITAGFTWEPQPMRRGTFSIISSCFVTLALCTWKIVHLNLPGTCPDETLPWTAWFKRGTTHSMRHRLVHILGGHQITRQIGWLLIGLFAPELIAYAAFRQYWDVKSLQAFMERVYLQPARPRSWWLALMNSRQLNHNSDVEDTSTKNIWTLTHSWYAVMGGYSYKLRDGPKVFLPDDRSREELVLRDEALRFVAEHEPAVIPKLSVLDILDKSSSSTFVKIIALFQALWFSLQCVVRMAQGLSISLLELTTFAHCIVALIIGWLWLRKPVDISKPDPLNMPDSVSQPHWLIAILYSLTSFDHNECDEDRYTKLGQAEKEAVQQYTPEAPRTSTYLDATINHDPITLSDLNLRHQSSAASMGRPTTGVPSRPSTSRPPPASPWALLSPPTRDHDADQSTTAGAASLGELVQAAADQERRFRARMQMAQKGWDHYILDRHPHEEPTPSTTTTNAATTTQAHPGESGHLAQRRLKRTMRNTLVDRVTNFPRRRHDTAAQGRRQQHAVKTHLGTSLTGLLYGGLHMLAWDATFTSGAEAALWKLAAVSLACSGLLVPVAHAEGVILSAVRPWLLMDEEDRDAEEAEHLAGKEARWERGWRRRWWRFYKWCFLWMIEVVRVVKVVGVVFVGCVYLGLRFFIFVECLANLSHLPPSAYDVVRWSQYVPHIS